MFFQERQVVGLLQQSLAGSGREARELEVATHKLHAQVLYDVGKVAEAQAVALLTGRDTYERPFFVTKGTWFVGHRIYKGFEHSGKGTIVLRHHKNDLLGSGDLRDHLIDDRVLVAIGIEGGGGKICR